MSVLKANVEISNVKISLGYKNSIALKVNGLDEIRLNNVHVHKGKFGWEYQYDLSDEKWLEDLSNQVKHKAMVVLDDGYDLTGFDLLNKQYGKMRAKESSYKPPQFKGFRKLDEDKVNVVDIIFKLKISKFKNSLYFSLCPMCYKFVGFENKKSSFSKKEKTYEFSDDDDENDDQLSDVEVVIDSDNENLE